MKKIIYRIIFLFLLVTTSISQNGWVWQNPSPQGNKIFSVSFPNLQTGYLGCDGGNIVKTTDGGLSWHTFSQDPNINLSCIAFFNGNEGIAGGGLNVQIARTTDGGLTWIYQTLANYDEVNTIQILNDSLAFAGTYSGRIYVTTNKGITWTYLSISGLSYLSKCWSFVNSSTAFMITNGGGIYKTTNSGINWMQKLNRMENGFYSISFKDANTGIVTGNGGKIFRTFNNGESWDSVSIGTQLTLNSVMFLGTSAIYACSNTDYVSNSAILKSTNSGMNWTSQDSYSKFNLLALGAADTNNIFAGGEYGKLMRSSNAGSNWIDLFSGFSNGMNGVHFFNSNTGYALGNRNFYESNGRFIKTSNGGINWTQYYINSYYLLAGMSFIDENTGFIVGNYQSPVYSEVYKTTNAGVNWVTISSQMTGSLNSIFFINANTGFTVGDIYIYKTTNSAVSWSQQSLSYDLQKIFFPGPDTGYITNLYGVLLKTIDGGESWIIKSSTGAGGNDLFFFNGNTGFVAGGKIVKTTDGGTTWQILFDNAGHGLNSITFLNTNTGYAVGTDGFILYTNNGGLNWIQQTSYSNAWLTGVSFTDQNSGWIVGYDGVILHINNGISYSVSGQVRYQDNNQPVTSGYVKAVHYDSVTSAISTLDSAQIQSNGSYMMSHILPHITFDIMAFENDEAQLSFVPTYYPSTTNWQEATTLSLDSSLNNINILVYRISNNGGQLHIAGHITKLSQNPYVGLNGAIVYAKLGNLYQAYSISDNNGAYRVDSLSAGSYNVFVDRMGFAEITRPVLLTNFSKDTIDFIMDNLSGLESQNQIIPRYYWLGTNYPNPFNPETKINFGIPKDSKVNLVIYDILGRKVAKLINEELKAGVYSVNWKASSFASGIYFYKLQADDFVQTKKMVLIK